MGVLLYFRFNVNFTSVFLSCVLDLYWFKIIVFFFVSNSIVFRRSWSLLRILIIGNRFRLLRSLIIGNRFRLFLNISWLLFLYFFFFRFFLFLSFFVLITWWFRIVKFLITNEIRRIVKVWVKNAGALSLWCLMLWVWQVFRLIFFFLSFFFIVVSLFGLISLFGLVGLFGLINLISTITLWLSVCHSKRLALLPLIICCDHL